MEIPLPPLLGELVKNLVGVQGRIVEAHLGLDQPLVAIIGLLASALLAFLGLYVTGWRARRLVARFAHPLAGIVASYITRSPSRRKVVVAATLEALALALLFLALAGPRIVVAVNTTLNQTVKGEFKVDVKPALVLVIDVSGSMAGAKIEAAKKALLRVVEIAEKRGLDVGLIAFNDHIVKAIPPGTSIKNLQQAIRGLRAGGGTMYTHPLLTALDWLKPYRAFRIPVAVVFATDGIPADKGSYPSLLPEYRRLGIPIYTVFIGRTPMGIQETRFIAEKTGGEQYTARNVEEIEKALVTLAEKAIKNIVEAEVEAKITTTVKTEKSLAPLLAPTATVLVLLAFLLRYRYTGTAI